MSRLMKFVMQVFRGKELTKIWSLELTKSRSRECAVDWTPVLSKPRNRKRTMARNLESVSPEVANSWRLKAMNLRSHELRESVKFGNMLEDKFGSHGVWRFPEREHSRTSKKQSQSCHLKKSGFNVWTSGRLVNIWDVKDICVCVHTRNILWVQGYCRNVKVLRLPIKGGVRARVRGFTTFDVRAVFGRLFVFSYVTCGFDLNVCPHSSLVFGGLIRIFDYPPTVVSIVVTQNILLGNAQPGNRASQNSQIRN
jgi:hypothetical protein